MRKRRVDLMVLSGLLAILLMATIVNGTQPMAIGMETEADQKAIREEALERLNNHLGSEDFDREGAADDNYPECDLGNTDDIEHIKTWSVINVTDETEPEILIFGYSDDVLIYEYVIGEFSETESVQITAQKKEDGVWMAGNTYEVLLRLDESIRVPTDQIEVTLTYPETIEPEEVARMEVRIRDNSTRQTEIFSIFAETEAEIYLDPSFPVWTTDDPRLLPEQDAFDVAGDILCLRLRTSDAKPPKLYYHQDAGLRQRIAFSEGGEIVFKTQETHGVARDVKTIE